MSQSLDDEDYLSDKYLVDAATAHDQPRSYSQLRKDAQKTSQDKDEQNKTKSRRQRELETREEGLNKSLFERAKEDKESGISTSNRALSMMMKMGFKPGQALGAVKESTTGPSPPTPFDPEIKTQIPDTQAVPSLDVPANRSSHIVDPIPLNEWAGKKGIGLGKRARSPTTAAERIAKMAKIAKEAEEISHSDYRNRARREYEERRAEGRLGPAQRTCATLDEQAGKSFNVMWLDPNNSESFPIGMLDTLVLRGASGLDHTFARDRGESIQSRLRRQMQADALQPLNEEVNKDLAGAEAFPSELIDEAIQFLRLQAQDRLNLVLAYLRDNHAYCFWCGEQYEDVEAMEKTCPGPDEESHD